MIVLIKEHIVGSGLFSMGSMSFGSMIASIIPIAGLIFGLIGAFVGLITIYTFLEKRGLTKSWPKWLRIPDKNKEENK